MPKGAHAAGVRPRKYRSLKVWAIILLILLLAFAGGFAWNLKLLPQVTRARDAYRAAPGCAAGDIASGSPPAQITDRLCRYSEVQVTFKWLVNGRYSTSYHVSLRDQDGITYPNVILNRAVFWKTTQVKQSLNAQIMNGKVTMLRSAHALVLTTDHPDARLYLVRMRILIFGAVTLLMFFLFQRWLSRARSHKKLSS